MKIAIRRRIVLSYVLGKWRKNWRKSKISCPIFSTVRRIYGTLGVCLFHLSKFASLRCGYLGSAPIPYVQDTILNLPNSYLRSTTVILDKNFPSILSIASTLAIDKACSSIAGDWNQLILRTQNCFYSFFPSFFLSWRNVYSVITPSYDKLLEWF